MDDHKQKGAAMNTQRKTDTWIYYLVLVLGFIAAASVVGSIALLLVGRTVPDILLALGTVSAAGLLKLLISPLYRELSG